MGNKYWLYSLLIIGLAGVLIISCEKERSVTLPELSTIPLSDLTSASVICGGNIASDGGAYVTARGVCWGTNQNPTVGNNFTSDGAGTGRFQSSVKGLENGTHYYIRAYASSSAGTGYGSEIIFITPLTDAEGNIYNTVRIGDQVWIRENLKTTKYNDNTDIPVVTDNITWTSLATPACSRYINIGSYSDNKYGVLYNWFTVNTGKLCPAGWHVPDEDEWTALVGYMAEGNAAGGKLKEQGTDHWIDPNLGASDDYGFTALPGGFRTGSRSGSFFGVGYLGRWWVNTESYNPWWDNADSVLRWARCRTLFFDSDEVVSGMGLKKNGYSVRCVKDWRLLETLK